MEQFSKLERLFFSLVIAVAITFILAACTSASAPSVPTTPIAQPTAEATVELEDNPCLNENPPCQPRLIQLLETEAAQETATAQAR